MSIGLIGYGRFGRLAARRIAKRRKVFVYDPRVEREPVPPRIHFTSLAAVASQDIVILAVPVSALRETLIAVGPHLVPGALIIDVCAVKSFPARWMKRMLPRRVQIIGSHPFFGPDSAPGPLRGHHIVICPIRVKKNLLNRVARVLRREGLNVSVMTPEAHDRLVAETILLTQYIGRLVSLSRLARQKAVTRNYAALLSMWDVAEHDSVQLFSDMVKYSAHGRRVVKAMAEASRRLARELP